MPMTEKEAIALFDDQVITAIQGVTSPPVNLNPGAVTSVLMGITVRIIMEAKGLSQVEAADEIIEFLERTKQSVH